ncbi:DUF58 domain-containing protein [Candidatus Woesearchaeota archaeon]|nr:DUF58 domain-containing protein [Candidatus Woesearchaeota archaeon]
MAISLDFLKHLDRMNLIINKKVTSNYVGERESVYGGGGLIFRDHRMYAPGDDIKRIDWKLFGRTDELFIKNYDEDKNLTVHIVLDYSGSMNFGTNTKKYEYASMLGLGFAYVAMKNNESFVLSTFSNELEPFRARRGMRQLAAIFNYLNKKKPAGISRLDESLRKYRKFINSKSLVVIISDFLYDLDEIKNVLYRFRNHEIKLIQVLDTSEKKMDFDGDFRLKDLETGGMLKTSISPFVRRRYLDLLAVHNEKIEKACDEVGAKFYSVHTGFPIFDAFHFILSK